MTHVEELLIGKWNMLGKINENEPSAFNIWLYLGDDGKSYTIEMRDAVTGKTDEENSVVCEDGGGYSIVYKPGSETVGLIILWSRECAEIFIEFADVPLLNSNDDHVTSGSSEIFFGKIF